MFVPTGGANQWLELLDSGRLFATERIVLEKLEPRVIDGHARRLAEHARPSQTCILSA